MAPPVEAPEEPARTGLGRRAFVRGCVAASAAALAGGAVHGTWAALRLGEAGQARRVEYLGATVVGGPAPQGLPLLPLTAGPRGEVRGQPAPPGLEGGVLDWYRYCGHEHEPLLLPGIQAGDEALVHDVAPDRLAVAAELRAVTGREDVGWQRGLHGAPVLLEHFRAAGFGAAARWRGVVNAIVLRVDPRRLSFEGDGTRDLVQGFLLPAPGGDALVAYATFCKHLCCVPGWHESARALREGAFETLYCTCHFSAFDPLRIRPDFFVLRG